ncbi:PrgI family protein [Pseudonocardia kunmingensis]|uniref:PrgI family protein n=1 Tax=Pseudonocardia kunmingensis TaxID=630975 RepID=A0A543D9H3_9PSEU|nr:PrgI family protein [Pseudonocardia kunmingensis]TQM05991.1 PrgI family protein [Pseudonocardia kunmingensis]
MNSSVRIPADVDMPDRVMGPLTARQLTILAATALLLYLAYDLTRPFLPAPLFGVAAVPIAVLMVALALGRRDGLSMDRMLLAAIRQRVGPRHLVTAPDSVHDAPGWLTAHTRNPGPTGTAGRHSGLPAPGALRLPASSVDDPGNDAGGVGVVDLGTDGLAVIAAASTVNFALRTPAEQESLVATFGRYLHSLTAPVQILVRTHRLDLTGQINELHARAADLPHPALDAAAREHAEFLAHLARHTDLLRRQVLLVLREPIGPAAAADGLGGPTPSAVLASLLRRRVGGGRTGGTGARSAGDPARRAAQARVVRRLGEAVDLLAPAGIVVTPLDADRAAAVLTAACNPASTRPPAPEMARPDDVITRSTPDTDISPNTGASPHRRTTAARERAHHTPSRERRPEQPVADWDDLDDDGWDYPGDDVDDDLAAITRGGRR